ncbi:MAG: GAF domain-containing protein [Nitrospirota bacterium]
MELLLNRENAVILNTFDLLNTPVLVFGADRTIILHNASANTAFQYSPAEIRGMGIGELLIFSPETIREMSALSGTASSERQQPNRSEGLYFESLCRRKNGDIFTARVSVVPYDSEGHSIAVIQDISDQKRLQKRANQRTKELTVFNSFAKVLTRHRSIENIMQDTIDMLLSLMDAYEGWIYLVDEDGGDLFVAPKKDTDLGSMSDYKSSKAGECMNCKAFVSGRPLLVKRASEDERMKQLCTISEGLESMACAPISSKGVTLGVLSLASRRVSFFTSMDIQLLATIGNQLGVAIENTRLIKQLHSKMKQIKLINELSSIINSSLSIGTVFRIMASEIRKVVDYDRASLLLYNEKKNNMVIFALDTDMKTVMKKGVKAPIEGTSAGWVIKNNQTWINDDLSIGIVFPLDRKLFDEGIMSTISIPLYQDKIIGVFNLDSKVPSKYSKKDLEVLLPVAKHISIALENALLFDEITREKKEWEKTFDAITDMVWIEDGLQRVIRANRTLLNKAGFSSVSVSGRKCGELLNRIGIHLNDCICADTIYTKKPSFRELKGEGGLIFNFWAYPLVNEDGHLYAIVHYLKDVTEQRRLELQLLRADKLASLGTLVAGIAHEVNNPLGIIAGYSEALLDRAKDKTLLDINEFEDFPEYLETIHNEIFRCKRILKSLLEFSRPSGRTLRMIDINQLIKEVIILVNHTAKRLNHNLELKFESDLPDIYAEPGKLRQLFMNIIINSMYFTPENGSILIETNMERTGPAGINRQIVVSITDTGMGIPADIVDKIFDPFFTTKPVGEGTGLGLAICHKIVEEHRGSIDVKSQQDRGTAFIIKLPAGETYD